MSVRARLLIGFVLVGVLLVVAGGIIVNSQRYRLLDQLDEQLAATAPFAFPPGTSTASRSGAPPPALVNPSSPVSNVFIATIDGTGQVNVVQLGQLLVDQPDLSGQIANSSTKRFFTSLDAIEGSSRFRVLILPSNSISESGIIAIPLDDVEQTVSRLLYSFIVLGALIGTALATVAWWVIRLGLRPITAMTVTADAIASGEKTIRAEQTNTSTEVGKLAAAFNTMLDQRDSAELRLRQFISDASHELRTPLTSIRGYLDLYENGGFREAGELDDIIARMQKESARMTALVEDLLLLAKLDEQRSISKTSIDLDALLADCVSNTIAAYPHRTLSHTTTSETPMLDADSMRLRQVILILLTNAVTHTPDGTRVSIHTSRQRESLEIFIEDNGPGMSADDAARVFDRFYRGDLARTRETGSSGLGLAIAKSIIEAHGGTLTLVTAKDVGCTFTICLPTNT